MLPTIFPSGNFCTNLRRLLCNQFYIYHSVLAFEQIRKLSFQYLLTAYI